MSDTPDRAPTAEAEAAPGGPAARPAPPRCAFADNLKVILVAGVIGGHAAMAWTDNEAWVLEEPAVREPLLTLLNLLALAAVLFAMALFFLIAGWFTPRSLERKGTGRFLADRAVRLGVPLVVYLLVLAPIVEYADVGDNAGWDRGFPAFILHSWRHPSPGPTWFLEVLLVLSVAYALVRAMLPRRGSLPASRPPWLLPSVALLTAAACYAIRLAVPFDDEPFQDLFIAQAPAWLAGFGLGIAGSEGGWLDRLGRRPARRLFWTAWSAVAALMVAVSLEVGLAGGDIDRFFGGPTWQSLVLASLQGVLVVAMPLWLFDVFRRRWSRQGRVMRELSRGAFVAFVVHQPVLVGAVLATRGVSWPPEVEWVLATALAIGASFGIGALVARIPALARVT